MSGKRDRLDFDVDEETATTFRMLAMQFESQGDALKALIDQHAEEVNDLSGVDFAPRRRRR